jgi:hypothetical protein
LRASACPTAGIGGKILLIRQPIAVAVLIVDDHPIVLQCIRQLLASTTDFDVVGETTAPEQALETAGIEQPDMPCWTCGSATYWHPRSVSSCSLARRAPGS